MTKLDRRKLLTSGAAAAVLASAGMGVAAQPRRGGLLRAALSGATRNDSWDMRQPAGLFMMAAAHGAVYETLTEIAADGSLRGELLETWHAQDGAQSWLLTLQKDVVFHSGKEFEAADLVGSLALHADPASPAHHIVDQIVRIDVKSRHQVLVHLAVANAGFPYQLADYHLLMYPTDRSGTVVMNGVGSGLYRVDSFVPGQHLRAARVNKHRRDSQAGWFDEISLLALNDTTRQSRALQDRRIDTGDLAQGRFKDGFSTRHVAGQSAQGVQLNTARVPFEGYDTANHPRLRVPAVVGNLWPMDNARLAERWWMA